MDQSRLNNQDEDFLEASAACEFLGVLPATLYSYVSRGLVRSAPAPGSRKKLYARVDLERVRARHDARAGHRAVAGGALLWGEPVLDTRISEIRDSGPVYRTHPAVELVRAGRTFEEVAELLWTGRLPEAPPRWPIQRPAVDLQAFRRCLPSECSPLEILIAVMPWLALADPGRHGSTFEADLHRLRRLLPFLACLPGIFRGKKRELFRPGSVAGKLATALGAPSPEAERAVDRALSLSADHELNASTFTARISASAGADLYACFMAALATLSGPQHGGACDRIEALVLEAGSPSHAEEVVQGRLRRGEAIPGFGHRLYSGGDPRTPPLLETAVSLDSRRPAFRTLLRIVEVMAELEHPRPSVDLGLVAIALALDLPPGSATAIFALGRAAGWGAHIFEQRETGVMLRPRARFTG